jgi:hypothetical protein
MLVMIAVAAGGAQCSMFDISIIDAALPSTSWDERNDIEYAAS